jgi:mono/diheme cytochrome c family protein
VRTAALSLCLAFAFALVVAGCGSSDSGGGSDAGRELFAARCGGCHTLKSAGTSGEIGPSFDDLRLTKPVVLAAIKSGPGVMPSELVTGADADKIADFLASASGGEAK